MTFNEFFETLEESGLPVAYDHFPVQDCPDPPFVVFREIGTNNFAADDIVHKRISRIEVELITIGKDPEAEAALEKTLDFTFWNMTESYAEDEKTWSTFYDIEINGGY